MDVAFNYRRVVHEHEFEGKITGMLGWILGIIPGLATGSEGYEIDEDIETAFSTSTLSVYGDFLPGEPLPSTLEQAVDFYRRLPTFFVDGTVMDVQLTPIHEFCNEKNPILNEISDDLVATSTDVLDELDKIGMKVRGLMEREVSKNFPSIQKNLQIFKERYDEYLLMKKSQLKQILPNIRSAADNSEDDLIAWINEYYTSAFQYDYSYEFLVNRTREIQAIGFMLDGLEVHDNIKVADYVTSTDVEFLFNYNYVMILEFNILNDEELVLNFFNMNPTDESNLWFNNVSTNGHFGSLLHKFKVKFGFFPC